ncbi:hypothetical protein H632_c2369p0, partial [Helicosporidium sp. ATCC 50920]
GPGARQAPERKRGRASEAFKTLVLEILRGGDFEQRRASKLTQDEFLALLAAFNSRGVHFA